MVYHSNALRDNQCAFTGSPYQGKTYLFQGKGKVGELNLKLNYFIIVSVHTGI